MLITRPNHDITTSYLYYWSDSLIKQANKNGRGVTDLAKNRANAKELSSVIGKTKPTLIVFNGHGSEMVIGGYNDEPLVKVDKSQNLLKGAVVYARSCQSAKILGRQAVKSGCRAYIGYDDDFVFVTEDENLTRPLSDKTAQLFLDPANQVVISLLKGHSAANANYRSKQLYKRNIQRLTTSAATKEETELIPYLLWDHQHQVCLGNQDAVA